jgi:hypothetical protein
MPTTITQAGIEIASNSTCSMHTDKVEQTSHRQESQVSESTLGRVAPHARHSGLYELITISFQAISSPLTLTIQRKRVVAQTGKRSFPSDYPKGRVAERELGRNGVNSGRARKRTSGATELDADCHGASLNKSVDRATCGHRSAAGISKSQTGSFARGARYTEPDVGGDGLVRVVALLQGIPSGKGPDAPKANAKRGLRTDAFGARCRRNSCRWWPLNSGTGAE